MDIEPFSIRVEDAVLTDLRARLRNTRLPGSAPGEPWQQGTDLEYLRELLAYWMDGYDWRAQVHSLNEHAHFRAELDGVRIHFVHARASRGQGIPLILTHGWPSTFAEYLGLVPLLTDPRAHGIDSPAFDVVIPSLPGYAFSERPARTGVTTRYTATLWHRLMRGLGYERYAAHGADFGASVTTFMALDTPGPLLGIHLSTLDNVPYTGPGSRPLSDAERDYDGQRRRWLDTERGYGAIQSTKPQTLGYALEDSPAGLAAWIIEKWRAWSDNSVDLAARFSRDFLLTTVMLYWVTRTITTSIRDYYDDRWFTEPFGVDEFVAVPTAFAAFANHRVAEGDPPREWVERLYDVRRWSSMRSGGHFAAAEEPELLARDIASFFGGLES